MRALHRKWFGATGLIVAALLLMTACDAALDQQDDGDPDLGLADANASGWMPGGAWRTTTFTVSQESDIDVVLDWSKSSVNLNVFLYDPSGKLVVFANTTTARPETVSYDGARPGTWKIGIKNKSSAGTNYTLTTTLTPSAFVSAYPGQPAPGTLFWGAAISGNGDPVTRHEQPSGHVLSLHRTYFQWKARTGGMVSQARDDVAHHRLPWVSIKTPPWADMAAGVYDDQIDAMLGALATVPGPVWLTVWHEPEGGGANGNTPDDPAGPAGHVAMNRRVRQRMTALGIHNVSLVLCLMSYTWKPASGRDPEDWWAPGIYDVLGVDHYSKKESTLLTPDWYDVRTFGEAKGVDVAVGEWGVRGTDDAAGRLVREWYDAGASSDHDGRGARVVGLSAFDSNLNSPDGGWELMGAQLTTFRELLGDPRTASIDDLQ